VSPRARRASLEDERRHVPLSDRYKSPTPAAGAVIALVILIGTSGCRSSDVLIGIEENSVASPPDDADGADGGAPEVANDGGPGADVRLGSCLPDAGCPSGAVCEYPVDAGGCGLPGICFAVGAGSPLGASGAITRPNAQPNPVRRLLPLTDPDPGFSLLRPSCEAGAEADAETDAADPH
jgi:hypothetical protein